MESKFRTNETPIEQAERLTKEVQEYADRISTIFDVKELEEEEKKCIKEIEEVEEAVKGLTYELPENTTFEGETYSKSKVVQFIINSLNLAQIQFQYTLGYRELVKHWKSPGATITYTILDSTLRCLQEVRYQGMQQWLEILVVNEYMKPLHDQYRKDNAVTIAVAQKHNAILGQMDTIHKMEQGEPEGEPETIG